MSKQPWQVREEQRMLESWDRAVVDAAGVPRWISNGSVPFDDMLQLWADNGKAFNMAAAQAARNADNAKFFAEYRKAQANLTPEQLTERRLEARAAHGPGVTLVDVITGDKFTT